MSTGDTETGKIQNDLWVSTTCRDRIDKLERLCWEMNKERGTDGLVWEQDMLAANRRIEALEDGMKLWAGKSAQEGYATSFVKDAWRKDINERIAAIEKLTCIKGNENSNGITSATARVAANEARIKALEDRLQTVWIAPINELKERCYALENAVASLKLCLPTEQPPYPPDIDDIIPCPKCGGTHIWHDGKGWRCCKCDPKPETVATPDDLCACVVGSAYPCEERQAFAVTNCIYFCGGICDYKRTHGKRPPEAKDDISEGIEAMRVLIERMSSSMWGKPKGFDSGVA
jgi:hypothetical protein